MTKRLPKDLLDLLEKYDSQIGQAFIDAVLQQQSDVLIKAVVEALKSGNITEAYRAVRIDERYFSDVGAAIRDAYWGGGRMISGTLSRNVISQPVIKFDGSLPRAESWVKTQTARLVTGIVADQRQLVQFVIQEGIAAGASPQTMALDIVGRSNRLTGEREGGFLGLTDKMAGVVKDMRAGLGTEAGMRHYLGLNLRDLRFDPTVKKALRDGKTLSAERIAQISTRYEARALAHRGRMIAENEAKIAVEAGRKEAYQQLIEDGTIAADQLTKTWHHTPSKNPRQEHIEMDGVSVGVNESFNLPDGSVMTQPHDPEGGAENNIGCFAPWSRIARSGLTNVIKHQYSGEIIELSIGSDINLAVTANHPILTRRGWIAAGKIEKSDSVVQCLFGDVWDVGPGADIETVETSAEQIYDAAEVLGGVMRISRRVVNFHGYIPDHDVDVIPIKGGLGSALKPDAFEVFTNEVFAFPDELHRRFFVDGPKRSSFISMAKKDVVFSGVRRLRSLFFGTHVCEMGFEGIGNCRSGNSEISKAAIYETPSNPELSGYRQDRMPAIGKLFDTIQVLRAFPPENFGGFITFGRPSHPVRRRQPQISEAGLCNFISNANFFGYLRKTFCSLMSGRNSVEELFSIIPRPVVEISSFHYEGPVYDFESSSSIIVANGIVTHNCNCWTEYSVGPKK